MNDNELVADTLRQWPDPDWCDATIEVAGRTLTCYVASPRDRHPIHHSAADHLVVEWDDDVTASSEPCRCDGHTINRRNHGGPCCGVAGGLCVACREVSDV